MTTVISGPLERAMPINEELWTAELHEFTVPSWPCPSCGQTTLELAEGTLRFEPDGATATSMFKTTDQGRFVCILKCERNWCRETCAVAGNYVEKDIRLDEENVYGGRWCKPSSFNPPVPIIPIPNNCPPAIREEVRSAFGLFWVDLPAALNRIRQAIELLLNDMGVRRHGKNGSGKRTRIALDHLVCEADAGLIEQGNDVLQVSAF